MTARIFFYLSICYYYYYYYHYHMYAENHHREVGIFTFCAQNAAIKHQNSFVVCMNNNNE